MFIEVERMMDDVGLLLRYSYLPRLASRRLDGLCSRSMEVKDLPRQISERGSLERFRSLLAKLRAFLGYR